MNKHTFGTPYLFILRTRHHARFAKRREELIKVGIRADANKKQGFFYSSYRHIFGDIHTISQFVGLSGLGDLFQGHPMQLWAKVHGEDDAARYWEEYGEVVRDEAHAVLQYAPELSSPPSKLDGEFVFHLETRHAPHLTDEREHMLALGAKVDGPKYYTYRTIFGDIHRVHQFVVVRSLSELSGEHPRALWGKAFGEYGAAMWRQYGQVVTEEAQHILQFVPELSDVSKK